MENPRPIYRFSHHDLSDTAVYQLIGKRILHNVPIERKKNISILK